MKLIYFLLHRHYFVDHRTEEVLNFDTKLQSRQFPDGWINNIQNELGYQETLQHDFLKQ